MKKLCCFLPKKSKSHKEKPYVLPLASKYDESF